MYTNLRVAEREFQKQGRPSIVTRKNCPIGRGHRHWTKPT